MKVIQSFWSKPLLITNEEVHLNRSKGGWLNYRYCLMSMAYNCLTFSKFYPNLELYTDSEGIKLFKDIMKLPYHKYYTDLDDIANVDESLWAYGKILAYSAQKEPFLHVDNDIFIWSEFPDRVTKADVVCQSLEIIKDYSLIDYEIALDYIREYIPEAPKIILNSCCEKAANMGIFGGNNIDFIQQYCKEANSLFDKLYDGILNSGNRKGIFNMIYEQLLLTELAKGKHQEVSYLITKCDLNELVKYSTIETAQYESKYTHCLGRLKKYSYICEQIEYRLKYEYPSYYYRILTYLDEQKMEFEVNNESMKGYDKFQKIYSNLNQAATIKDVMSNYKFQLDADCQIEEEGDDYFMLSPRGKAKLEGWQVFLNLFLNANTGSDVCKEICNEKYLPNLSQNEIFSHVFYLIMESLYISKYLTVA